MSNKPAYIAYTVKPAKRGEKATWTEIGVAWPHRNGSGLNIELVANPLDGRLVLMPPKAMGSDTFEGDR